MANADWAAGFPEELYRQIFGHFMDTTRRPIHSEVTSQNLRLQNYHHFVGIT